MRKEFVDDFVAATVKTTIFARTFKLTVFQSKFDFAQIKD
jgi:hypothetical protein